MLVLSLILSFFISPAHAGCEIHFDCSKHTATINHRSYPIVCGGQTARGFTNGSLGALIRASGPWRPGLVRPGTPMLDTHPRLCNNCFIHAVSGFGHSFGCLGISSGGFSALKACGSSQFAINR
jgi:hypothetical protein